MRIILLISLFLFTLSLIGQASPVMSAINYVLPAPPKTEDARSLYNYLNTLYGRFNQLQVTTQDPNGNIVENYGSTILYVNGSTYILEVQTTSPNGSTWVGINLSGSGISGISSLNGLTASTQLFVTGTSGTDFTISSSGSTHTFNIPTASASNRGLLSSTDWTIFNNKFTLPGLTLGSVLFSNGSTISQDNSNLFWDSTNHRLGIGNSSPSKKLDVTGDIKYTNSLYFNNQLMTKYSSDESDSFNFFGYQVGGSVTTGTDLNFFGYQSGYSNTTGLANNFIGAFTGYANTTGHDNNYIGYGTGQTGITSNYNVMIGTDAGPLSTGDNNTFIGTNAGQSNTSGSLNIFIGPSATNNSTGSNNTFIGNGAGETNISGSYNIAIGDNANINPNNLTNAIAIGKNAVVSSSNSMVLGGLGVDAIKVGIATAPIYTFHVNGSIGVTSLSGTGKVVCVKSDGSLGVCSDQPNGSGVCTCS